MGLLDSVVGALGQGGTGGGGQQQLMQLVMQLLAEDGPAGGLGGLVAKLQQGGLGDVVASWISTGQNLPISADQLSGVLGPNVLGGLAQQAGLSHGDLAGQLSQLLPQVVDRLTPHGQLPAAGAGAGDLGSLLGSLLSR